MAEPVSAPQPGSTQPAQEENVRAVEESERSRWSLALRGVAIALVAGLLGLLVWATLAAGRGATLVARVAAGKKPAAPGFTLGVIWPHTETWPSELKAAIADGKLNLGALRGHAVVLNFWASWCIPCRQEAPILHASALRHRERVVFVGLDVKDLTGDAVSFARKYRLNYVSARAGFGGETWDAYGLTGVPETYFLDGSGRIVAHIPGAVTAQTLEEGVSTITRSSRGGVLQGGAHVTP